MTLRQPTSKVKTRPCASRVTSDALARSLSCYAVALLTLCLVLAPFIKAQGGNPSAGANAVQESFSKDELLDLLKKIAPMSARLKTAARSQLAEQIRQQGVDFKLTPADESALRAAGASPALIEVVRANYRPPAPDNSRPRRTEPAPAATPAPARDDIPPGAPLNKAQVLTLLRGQIPPARVERMVEVRGVDFALTPEVTREIIAAGGNRSLVGAIGEKFTAPPPAPVRSGEGGGIGGGTGASSRAGTAVKPTTSNANNNSAPSYVKPAPGAPVRGTSNRGYLSVRGLTLSGEAAARVGLGNSRGFLIDNVREGSTAAAAGLRAGDVVTNVNGVGVPDTNYFWKAITPLRPGSQARLTVWREGRSQVLTVAVADYPLYLELVEQANAELAKSNADAAVGLLRRAVDLDPAERDAYLLLSYALLYYKGQFQPAADVMLKGLERDGVVVFRVSHDHSGGTLRERCFGTLVVARNVVSFVADNDVDKFRAGYGEIRGLKVGNSNFDNVFTIKLQQAGGASEFTFSTNAPLNAAGAQKFEASGVAPALRSNLLIDEARLIVQLIKLGQR
jgi:hypothetical protein